MQWMHFLQLKRGQLLSSCCSRASHCDGFPCCRAWALDTQASVDTAHGFSSCGSLTLERGLTSCGSQAKLPHSMWDLPGSEIKPKKEFMGPGLHLRPVHADHAQPPFQWTLNSVFSAYENNNRRIRPPPDRGTLKIVSRLLIA